MSESIWRLEEILGIQVDRAKPIPVYIQIVDAVRELLKKEEVPPGTLLPPERVLCQRYKVNRLTLRQAFDILEHEGLIERQRGRGTIVAPRRLQKEQQELRGFSEEMSARGAVPSSKLLSFRHMKPAVVEREFFGLPEGEQVYEIRRIRFKEKLPLAIETVQIPCYLCPNLDQFNLATDSIYRILETEFDVQLGRGIEEISALHPNRSQREILNLPRSAAVLRITRRTYTKNDTPLEITTSIYRGDIYRAIVRSVRIRQGKAKEGRL